MTKKWTGKDVRDLRERRGETQTAFAVHFGVDQSTISLWETEGNSPSGPAVVVLNMLDAATRAEAA